MRKKFTIFLILTFILGLVPVNFSVAITKNQIDAEVQIYCVDKDGYGKSGSGTMIDPKGIILTNRHVIEGAYMNTCLIGFVESIGQNPNFGTAGNYNLAEVKYQTTSSDMDAAILYLNNPTNKIYPYINIWDSNSDALQFGDKIDVIGFPGIGGSTITYTSGDFSGFGDKSDWSKNCIKTTAILGQGNSGGAAYNAQGQFIGVPTWVVNGVLNSMGYILSVNSIKSWLSGILGSGYQAEIIEQDPVTEEPVTTIQDDITPPSMNSFALGIYGYDESSNFIKYSGFNSSDNSAIYEFSNVSFGWFQNCNSTNFAGCISDNSGEVAGYYYYFGTNPNAIPSIDGKYISNNDMSRETIYRHDPKYNDQIKLPLIFKVNKKLPNFFILQAQDKSNNISNILINFQYIYEMEEFKYLKKISFFEDESLTKMLDSYDVDFNPLLADKGYWHKGSHELLCYTKLNSLTIQWEYPKEFSKYFVKSFNSFRPLIEISVAGEEIDKNYYTINNLKNGNNATVRYWLQHRQDLSKINNTQQKYFEVYLKPVTSSSNSLSEKHSLVDIIYDPNIQNDIECSNQYYVKSDKRIDYTLSNKLKGQILLQVEQNGEAYYIYPNNSKKYYLGRPADAFSVMRKLGLGATHEFIISNTIFPDNVLGKILLDVEQNGEAYYIYPKDKKAYYLGRPADAFQIMRNLGLGITNDNLNKIPEGSL